MTIEYTYMPTKVSGDGVTKAFDFDFTIYQKTDVAVQTIDKTTGADTDYSLSAGDYTVDIDLVNGGGTVTFTAAPASTDWAFLYSNLANTQPITFALGGKLKEDDVEQMGDRSVQLIQQLVYESERKFGFAISSTDEAPDVPALEADTYLYTDGSTLSWRAMTITETQYDGTISRGLDANKPSSPSKGDIYYAEDTKYVYHCYTGGIWDYDGLFDGLTVSGAASLGGTLDVTGSTTLSTLGLSSGTTINEISTDGTLAGDSDDAVPTEKAVKTYVDNNVPSSLTFGAWTTIDTHIVGGTGATLSSSTVYQTNADIQVWWKGAATSVTANVNLKTKNNADYVADGGFNNNDTSDSSSSNTSGEIDAVSYFVPSGHWFTVNADADWSSEVLSTRTYSLS